MVILAAALRKYKWGLSYNRVRTIMLMQVAVLIFTKIDNSFAFFDFRRTRRPPAWMVRG